MRLQIWLSKRRAFCREIWEFRERESRGERRKWEKEEKQRKEIYMLVKLWPKAWKVKVKEICASLFSPYITPFLNFPYVAIYFIFLFPLLLFSNSVLICNPLTIVSQEKKHC